MRLLISVLVFALAACGAAEQVTTAPDKTLTVGSIAPAFELPGSDGKTHKLEDYRGDHVVLAFFPKAFTGG